MGDWFVSKPSKGHRVEEVTIDDVVRVKSLDRSIDWACVANVTTGVDALKINGRYFESAAGQSKIKSIFCAQPEMLMRHLRGRSGSRCDRPTRRANVVHDWLYLLVQVSTFFP